MKKIAEQIIEALHESIPRKSWEMDKETFDKIHKLHDDDMKYLCARESNYPDKPDTLLGIPIVIMQDKCFQLRFDFPNGSHEVVAVDIEI